jgi:hypothetical protein
MFPRFQNICDDEKEITFNVNGTECFFVNCLRRSIIADVNTVAFPEVSEETDEKKEDIREDKKEYKKRKLFLNLFVEDLLERGSILNYNPGFITIHENTSNFHNEIVMKRLSLIPVHLDPIEFLQNPSKYTFSIEVTHDTSSSLSLLDVTTADIQFHRSEESVKEEEEEEEEQGGEDLMEVYERKQLLKKIFPPHTILLDQPIFEKVKSKLFHDETTFSEETMTVNSPVLLLILLPGQKIHVTMRPSVSSSFFHAAYSAVTHAFYTNTLCQTKIAERRMTLKEAKDQEDFDCHGKHRYFITNERGVASSFDFVVKSIGTVPCREIIEVALQTIVIRLSKMKKQLSLKGLTETSIPLGDAVPFVENHVFYHYTLRVAEVYQSSFVPNTKFHMNNGHSIANLIQGVLYNFYTQEKRDDLFLVSYRKPSPLDIRQDHETLLDTEVHFPHALDPHIEYLFVWGFEKDSKAFSEQDALGRITTYIEFVKEYVEGALSNFQISIGEKKMM